MRLIIKAIVRRKNQNNINNNKKRSLSFLQSQTKNLKQTFRYNIILNKLIQMTNTLKISIS